MNPTEDVLYRVHRVQAARRNRTALSYAQFTARVQEAYEKDLTRLLAPHSGEEVKIRVKRENRFYLGHLSITPEAAKHVPIRELVRALDRHAAGDWGTPDQGHWASNDRALREGGRLLSIYQASTGQKFWIVTEADRASTTILLPEEF